MRAPSRRRTKKCCGKHAELNPRRKVRISPARNKGIPLNHTAIPKISANLLPGRNAIPSGRGRPCQDRLNRPIDCLPIGNRASKRREPLGYPADTGNPLRRNATGSASPAPPVSQAPTSEPSETEVEIRGGVPATSLAALAHPAARHAELGSAHRYPRQVRADAELIGTVIAETADFRTEEHARADDVIAEPANGVV